mgnify:CR=1 FL=1
MSSVGSFRVSFVPYALLSHHNFVNNFSVYLLNNSKYLQRFFKWIEVRYL